MMKDWIILPTIRIKASLFAPPVFNAVPEVLADGLGQMTDQRHAEWSEKSQSAFVSRTGDRCIYVRNLIEFTKKLVEDIWVNSGTLWNNIYI